MKLKFIAFAFAITMVLGSCNKEDQFEIDKNIIEQYLADNNLTAEKTEEGVYYIVAVEGNDVHPTVADDVKVHYKGYTLEGNIFDSSYDRGEKATFPLANVILGWQIGIPKFSEGGSGTLIIPSELAYGENPPGGSVIGTNEVLAFDIELFEVL